VAGCAAGGTRTLARGARLQHRARMLGVAGRVPEVGGEQPARDRLTRAREQPAALDAHTVLLVPAAAAPACGKGAYKVRGACTHSSRGCTRFSGRFTLRH